MTASWRLATLPLLALALVAVLLVPPPPPADAQTETATVLVSNTGRSQTGNRAPSFDLFYSQSFDTGSNPLGYSLDSIVLRIGTAETSTFENFTLTVREDASGSPHSTVLYTLTNPATTIPAGLNEFAAPSGATLDVNTTYHVVAQYSGFGSPSWTRAFISQGLDPGTAEGWDMTTAGRTTLNAGTSWSVESSQRSFQMQVKGSVFVPPPPVRVTGFDLDSGNFDPRGMWGNEDTFWVANNGTGSNNKIYAYDRADGSRDSANDFDNLDGAGNTTPEGVCSDGTTMFVADGDDDKVYAYKMSDTTADSTKDITLSLGNGQPRGLWCDGTTVYVANDDATSDNKVFAYKISDGTAVTANDFDELYLSTNTAAQNAETPRGIWSDGTTMFVADGGDDSVFAYKHSDESQDSAKNLALSSGNDDPEGMWFDGRVLWVVDDADDKVYAYDLPGAQPDNTPADGAPAITSAFTHDVLAATVTPAEVIVGSSFEASGYATAEATAHSLGFGSISESLFTVDGVTYTVLAVFDDERAVNSGDLVIVLDRELPRGFTFTVDGVSYSSADAAESEPGTGLYQYQWAASSLHWPGNVTVVLNVETPKQGVAVTADVSGITDSADGVASASFQYQWIRVDGADETDIDGETGSVYTPTADDVDKHLKVRVVFDDDAGYLEYPRTSPQLGPVAGPPPQITSIAVTSDPGPDETYIIGDDIVVTFTFDKDITLSGTGANPQAFGNFDTRKFGETEVDINCTVAAPPTKDLVCTHTVVEQDEDSDGFSIGSASTLERGKRIVGPFGQRADTTHSGLPVDSGHKVDGVRPELTRARASADKTKVILTFSEVIGTADRTKITFDSGGTTLTTTGTAAIDLVTQRTVTITLTTALTAADTDVTVALAAGAVTDAVGNAVLAATAVRLVDEIWSATLTVQDTGSGFRGCSNNTGQSDGKNCSNSSVLTDDTFSYDNKDHEVDILELKNGNLTFDSDVSFTAAALRDLTLNVGSDSFPFENAAHTSGTLRWDTTGLTWSEDDVVTLSIDADPPPMLVTAQVQTATTIHLIFDQGLDGSLPVPSAFAVTVNGSSNSVQTVENNAGDEIILTVGTAMSPGDTVEVTYTKPSDPGRRLKDAAGNETEPFTQELENLLRDTLVSNLGQTSASGVNNLSSTDISQAFMTGPTTDAYTLTGVKVKFDTVPTASATVSAFIADGLASTDSIVVNLTNPDAWSATSTFGIPSGATLDPDTTYYLIIEGSDGTLHRTATDNEDAGAVTGWSIANTVAVRPASSSNLGGTWTPNSAELHLAVEGIHKGIPGIPGLSLTAKDETIEMEVVITDHGREDLTDIEYRYKATDGGTYSEWTSVTGTVSNSGGTFEISSLANGTEYTVQVQGVNDSGDGLPSSEEAATPDAPPAITSVEITSTPATAGTYIIGDDIVVTFTFDKDITLTDASPHTPNIFLYLGIGFADEKEPECVLGTAPTKVLACTHTVGEGDEDTDGIVVSGLAVQHFNRIVGPFGQLVDASHSGLAADSGHKVDGVRPELTGARPSADMSKVILTFSEVIGTADRTKITFDSSGTTLATTGTAAIDHVTQQTVTLTLDTALTAADTDVTVALAADAVTDAVGNGNAVLAATALVDETPPTLSETSTPSDTEVLLVYDEPLDPDSVPAASAFSVAVNTGRTARTVSAAALSGTSGIVLTVSPAFRPGDLLTVDYTVPDTNPVRDIAENEAAALDIELVDNTLDATAPEAVGSLTVSDTSTFGEVDLRWSRSTWDNGSAITGHEVRYGDQTPIWSATLTVKDLGSNFLGCDSAETNKGCLPADLLTDNTFSYDSLGYQIETIDLIGGQLRLQTSRVFSAAALANLVLDVGGRSLPLADATQSLSTLTWTGTGLSWSEDDAVSLAMRSFTAWTAIADSAPGGANAAGHTLEGLVPGAQYTFEVRAVNDIGAGGAASDTLMLLAPVWEFTLRDSGGNDVTGLVEGGDPATATVTITNAGEATFGADQEIALEWGGIPLSSRIRGAGNTSAITIAAGASSGSLVISAPDNDLNPVYIPETHDLTAEWAGAVIATIEQFRRIEDEDPPVARIADAPESVNEGDTFDIDIELSVRYPVPGALKFAVTDSDSALSGTLPDSTLLVAGTLDATVTLTAAENTTQSDGARTVTFTLETSTGIPYTLGTPHTVTVIVRDDDTPPLAVGNLRAQAGNTEATLRWDTPAAPAPDHGQPILHYEYRVKVGTGSFGSWTMVPGSDGATTSHKFTGLTNETVYAYEVRAENVAGDGAETSVTVTPRVGVAVSFGSATASITEGGAYSVVVTLDEAPATGATVVVPITATRGAGLAATEYSGVPASVTFAEGDTSKSFTVTVAQDSLDEPDEELTLELGTLPEGYVAGTNSEIVITVADDDTALLGFTLRDSASNDVMQLVEGGASATATVWITNSVRFETDQTVTLEWGGQEITSGPLIQGAAGSAAVTITAGQSNGTLAVSAPQRPGDLYRPPVTETLTATHGGSRIGGGIDLKYVDDEDPPVFTISLEDLSGRSGTRVVEGGTVRLVGTLSRGYDLGNVFLHAFAMGATTRIPALGAVPIDGQPNAVFAVSSTESGYGLTPTGNSAAGDHATVTFTIPSNPDYYTIGAASTATLLILDDDAAPGAVRNIAARPGDTGATLRWDRPATYDQVWVSDYQYRRRAGTGPWTSWAAIDSSDAETTSHTFTGLTNEIEYTFEVRGRNANHNGAVAQVQVTPREGVAVSFGAASASVNEGGSVTVTVMLGEAPAAGASVTAPITATPGAGFGASEYSGVPASVVFNAGDTSKTFTVSTVNDTDDEPDRLLTLGLGTLPEGYVPGTHATLEVTVADDDVPIVSVSFDKAADSGQEGTEVEVTVRLTQAPEREVVAPITATRGANLAADEHEAAPSSVTFGPGETEQRFTLKFEDDAEVEGNETLTLGFGTLPVRVNSAGENPDLVLTILDDDGPPQAPDVTVRTGNAFAVLSWQPVVNDSPVLRYEVRWRETDGGTFNAWQSVGLVTSYRVEALTNGAAHIFEVQAVNAHGSLNAASVSGMPTERLTGIPKVVQGLWVRATDSGRAELRWWQPANATDEVITHPGSTMSEIQGYRIEVCRTTCGDDANWYALVANTGEFKHTYTHQVLAPGVIRENRYRVRAININGKAGPWSKVATLDPTVAENVWLQTPDDSTLWVRFKVRNPDGNPLYVRYTNTATGAVGHTEHRLTKKQGVKLVLSGLAADSWYKVELDFSPDFDSPRRQSHWYGTAREGETPLTSPYARDLVDAEVYQGGAWRDASTTALTVRMGEVGKYRVRLKPCTRIYTVIPRRIQAPAGRLQASPTDFDPTLFSNLRCEVEGIGYRTDENGNYLTMSDVYDMTNFADRANDRIPIYGGSPNDWYEVTVTARALEDYAADVRPDALLSAPFAVVYNHEVYYGSHDTRSGPVSEGSGLVRILVDRPADAVLPVPGGVTIGSDRVMSWDAVPGAWGYLVEWRHGLHYGNRANQNRSLQAATSVTLPPGASGRGPVTARVRAYSGSGVSGWVERTWDSRAPTLNVFDTVVNEADGSTGFLVTLEPAASGTVTVDYATTDATAVAPADFTATSGTLTFAPGQTRKTVWVPVTDDGEEDSGETFRLVLANPTGSDANNGAAVLGDTQAVATILNSEREVASLTGFTLVDAGTNAVLMTLADGSTVRLGELLASSYGIRAEMSAGAAPGSVRIALTGAKTVTGTDDAAPWSLYGDGAGRVNGASLPVGSYTLAATAYANSGGRGAELGSLDVSFTVAAGPLAVTTPGPFTVAEGETTVTALAASETGTGATAVWSIPAGADGGADGAAFALTAGGVLSLVAAKDFEAPDDADGDGTYEVTVSVTSGTQTATAALSVTLTDVDEAALAVTTPGLLTVAEGETTVTALAASDTGTGATAVWSIPAGVAGGADGAAFALTSGGVLSLVAAKDFEAPDDADGDGTYEVTVAAAVPASSMAGTQSATAALLVTLTDVNEAPVAQASAFPARVRQGAEVTLDASASTDPDAGDTLAYLWTQADDGAPRVALSDASAGQPAFTSPSDLESETALGFTLRVTDAAGLHAHDTVTVTVTLISEVSISAASNYAAEGDDAVFALTRTGSARAALTVPVTVQETGSMLGTAALVDVTFAAGASETELRVPTAADEDPEADSEVTVRLASGSGRQLAPGAEAATVTVLDDDAAPVTETAAADVTVWSADMEVVEYWSQSIGAGSADLFSNQMGRAGLRAKRLWYNPVARVLRLGFDAGLYDAEALTLHIGDVSLSFPDGTGGNASFTLEDVDLTWTDGETLEPRITKPSPSAVSTDATLASLGIKGATLSPAFDARVLLYWAVADAGAETVTVTAQANDAGAAVAYSPATDADAEPADHQMAAPTQGETLVAVTVTAADGTVRRYRVVVAPAAAGPNTTPTGAPTVNGTPQVHETLTADTSTITDEDGLTNPTFEYQWIAGGSDIDGATGSGYTLTDSEQGKTIQVRVTFTDDADNAETLTSAATAAVAAAPNRDATGAPTVNGTPQVDQTLTADTSAITDEDGLENVSYRYQWVADSTDIDGATGSSYTLTDSEQGKTIQIRVTFTDDTGNSESLTSEPTDAVAADPTSLTATFTNVPTSHSGSGTTFTFDLAFSENLPLSYRTLRDHAFTEDDHGPVVRAQRKVQGSNQTWTITVDPKGNGAITITLPATTDCNDAGAICTSDRRKLSNSLSVTVNGPDQ